MNKKIKTFETFREISSYEISNLKQDNPSSFNGNISFRKYKITIEPIDESFEILSERLQKLWDECGNHHHWSPLEAAAQSIGYTLVGFAGSKKTKKNN